MRQIKKLGFRFKRTGGGLIHDSRGDVRILAEAVMLLTDKVNELVDSNNVLERELDAMRQEVG